mmetsp:Transcript_30253/g.48692  ORF Transcript_30253/g.48692 Transcript_30253/m.48692 type:complete len:468 (+) Transcript_30253:301-1704(+)
MHWHSHGVGSPSPGPWRRPARGAMLSSHASTLSLSGASSGSDGSAGLSGGEGEGRDEMAATVDEGLPPSRSPLPLEDGGDGVAHGSQAKEWEAALLVTGTAVGGGSLALPYFCAAGGFLPAVSLLLVSYTALLGSAWLLVEPTIRVWEDKPGSAVSMHSVVDTYLGKYWGVAAGVTFWVLINCTLVSQLAKCGELAALMSGGALHSRIGSIASALVVAGFSFNRGAGKVNALATGGLFAAFGLACVAGAPGVSTQLLLAGNMAAALPALPAILQTMTYAEAIPTVVDMCRGSRTKVRRVLMLGSLGPTVMYSLWLAVTLGRRELATFGATGGDLAGKILSDGGMLGVATGAIAVFASISTLIGCYLALSRFMADTFSLPLSNTCVKLVAATVVPSALISLKGPELYYIMIKFAGCVPVAFLWGVLPPLVMWTMWRGDHALTLPRKLFLAAGCGASTVAMVVGGYYMC